jgi:hypothetical protein
MGSAQSALLDQQLARRQGTSRARHAAALESGCCAPTASGHGRCDPRLSAGTQASDECDCTAAICEGPSSAALDGAPLAAKAPGHCPPYTSAALQQARARGRERGPGAPVGGAAGALVAGGPAIKTGARDGRRRAEHTAAPRRRRRRPPQVHDLQNALAAVSDSPGLGLSEAAELLHSELGASLVG